MTTRQIDLFPLSTYSLFPWSAYEDYRIDLIGDQAASTIISIYTTDQWAARVDVWGTEGILAGEFAVKFRV